MFTYGPCGFLASRYYFEHAAPLRFATDLALALCVAAGVVRLAGRMKWFLRAVYLFTLLYLATNIDPRYDLLLYIGLFSWAALSFCPRERWFWLNIASLALLAAFGALVKSNFLLVGLFTVIAVSADLALRRERRAAGLLVALTGILFSAGWFVAGQKLGNLFPFFSHVVAIANGYNAAVGLDGLEVFRSRGLVALILALSAAFLRASVAFPSSSPDPNQTSNPFPQLFRRTLFGMWLVGFLFVVWKHGFVRADLFHVGFFFGFYPLFVLALIAFPSAPSSCLRISAACSFLCWAILLFTVQRWCFAPLPASLIQPFRRAVGTAAVLMRPQRFANQMQTDQTTAFAKLSLPETRRTVGAATIDVFGQDQLYALHNHLNYRPRPVFQSYMGYNRDLDRINEQFYLSPKAPDYVLFQLTPVDRKFPPLEDSFVLRDLLLNYQPILQENPILLLKKQTVDPPYLSLVRQTTVHLGQPVNLADLQQTNVWVEIEVAPSVLGRVRGLLYKVPPLRVRIGPAGSKSLYKAPAPMLAAGFIVSPLLFNQADVLAFYESRGCGIDTPLETHKLTRPDLIAIECDKGTERLWKNEVHCRIYAFGPAAR